MKEVWYSEISQTFGESVRSNHSKESVQMDDSSVNQDNTSVLRINVA